MTDADDPNEPGIDPPDDDEPGLSEDDEPGLDAPYDEPGLEPQAQGADANGHPAAAVSGATYRQAGLALLPQHEALLTASAIAPEVAKARDYRSVTEKVVLKRYRFNTSQQRVPALLIPIRNAAGEIALHQIRPDDPRVVEGKSLKYENPAGSQLILDVPAAARESLQDTSVDLFITEGARKVDAATSAGLACIGVLGVWGWKAETALADFDLIALTYRTVQLAFDSDVVTKPEVRLAVTHLGRFLSAKGANVNVLLLPGGEDGEKVGLDDFFAAGHTVEQLLELAEPLEQWVPEQPSQLEVTSAPEDPAQPIEFETLRAFLKRPVPAAESLVGVTRGGTNLFPRFGWVMPWGREGCAKTSLVIDAVFHGAEGRPWLHYPVARPLRFVLIINEGVPGGLQDKLAEKVELWDGDVDTVLDEIALYASPWGKFTFKNARMGGHLRDFALDFGADYIVLDPLHTMGTTGAGTPQETEEFKHLLMTHGLWDDLGFVTAHHSNKSGMVSGDWGRHCDTLIRLEKDGKRPATKFTIEKARPADPNELLVPQMLEWVPATMGYDRVEIVAREKVPDAELLERIYDAMRADPDATRRMSDLQQVVKGDTKRISELVKTEIEAGRMLNTSTKKSAYALKLRETAETEETENLF